MDTSTIVIILLAVLEAEMVAVLVAVFWCVSKLKQLSEKSNPSKTEAANPYANNAYASNSFMNQNNQAAVRPVQNQAMDLSMMPQPTPQMMPQSAVQTTESVPQVQQENRPEGTIICTKCYSPLPVYGKFCPNCSATIEGR